MKKILDLLQIRKVNYRQNYRNITCEYFKNKYKEWPKFAMPGTDICVNKCECFVKVSHPLIYCDLKK